MLCFFIYSSIARICLYSNLLWQQKSLLICKIIKESPSQIMITTNIQKLLLLNLFGIKIVYPDGAKNVIYYIILFLERNKVVVSQNIGLRILSRPASWTFRFVRYRILFSWSTRISFHLCTSSNI